MNPPTAQQNQPSLITYSEVIVMLKAQSGLRHREALLLVQQNQPPPHPHRLHSRRLWLRREVESFCQRIQQEGIPTTTTTTHTTSKP